MKEALVDLSLGRRAAFGPSYDSTVFGIVANDTTDITVAAQAAVDELSAAGGGRLRMFHRDRNKAFRLDGQLWARNKVVIEWCNDILMGANGSLGVGGTLETNNSALLTTLAAGSTTLAVANASLFQLGDIVVIEDAMTAAQLSSGTSTNLVHIEVNLVIARDTVANTITVELPLAHAYSGAHTPKVTRVNPARHAGHLNPTIRYAIASSSISVNAMEFKYAAHCFVERLRVMGDIATGLGSRGHGCRFGEGTYMCRLDDFELTRPGFFDSGAGYGVTFYSGARANRASKLSMSGTRHAVLFFRGVADNQVEGVISQDCRGTDIDFHGANEVRNTVTNVHIIGGPSSTADITQKAAIKFGNPTHRAGARENVVRNITFTNYGGYAVHFLPVNDNLVENISGNAARGIYLQSLTQDDTLLSERNTVRNITFTGGIRHCEIDGGLNKVVRKFLLDGMTVRDAQMTDKALVCDNSIDVQLDNVKYFNAAAGVSSYLLQAVGSDNMVVNNMRGDGAKRFASMTNCPNATITRPVLSNQTERVPVYDAGGNTNMKILDYETSYDPLWIDAGAGSTGFIKRPLRQGVRKVTATEAGAVLPVTSTGVAGQIVSGTVTPDQTAGALLFDTTFKSRVPKGRVRFSLMLPYIHIDSTNTVTVTMYRQLANLTWVMIGMGVTRLTAGTAAGQSLSIDGTFTHAVEDMALSTPIQVRFGSGSTTAITTIGGRYGGNDNPLLQMEDVLDN